MRFILLGLISGLAFAGCSALPPPVVSLDVQPQVEVNGFHSVFLDESGQVWTWGDNRFGQLGNGTTTASASPAVISGLPTIAAVAAGGGHTMALTTDGNVWTWGGNHDNTLGVSTDTTTQTTPVQIAGLDHIVAITAGDGHGVALRSNGTVWTWGINKDGQTGLSQDGNHPFPEQVQNIDHVTAIAAGDYHTLVLREDRTVWASGLNNYGQLGDDSTQSRSAFAEVKYLTNVTAITAGEFFSMTLDAYGDVWVWGDNRLGQAGLDPTIDEIVSLPTRVTLPLTGQPNVTMAAGGSHGLALDDNGILYSWGYNYFSQLGYETAQSVSPTAQLVPLLDSIAAISAGDNNSLVLSTDDTLWAWGDNEFGQIGDGTTDQRPAPVIITLPANTTAPKN